jgi:di-heme oxidoreductase (putative peroxidase)
MADIYQFKERLSEMNQYRRKNIQENTDDSEVRQERSRPKATRRWMPAVILSLFCGSIILLGASSGPVDPGVRSGAAGAGGMIGGMTSDQITQFVGYRHVFTEINNQATSPVGLGPGYDAVGCAVCHVQPAGGGSSPKKNPLFGQYQMNGAQNAMPSFITTNGPVVNARSPFLSDGITPDGHVQQLFVITGRSDAVGCNATQPDFVAEQAANNLIFRQTTPLFGEGLMEIVQNSDILANMNANLSAKQALGISGHPSIAVDGSISRFGWKAQGRSLILFSGEAYNIEEGITNELSPNQLNQTPGCDFNALTEDHTNFVHFEAHNFDGDPEDLGNFMRFLAPPTPAAQGPSQLNGQAQFNNIGCVLCHTTSFKTPPAAIPALNQVTFNLFSDMLVHHMGPCLADNVVQGNVMGDEFRTVPLWGVGQRVFFMHDGRTTDIVQAIQDHSCAGNSQYGASEANGVIGAFNALSTQNQQDLVNFLRSL